MMKYDARKNKKQGEETSKYGAIPPSYVPDVNLEKRK
jgi:hypothetical protein